MSDARRYVGVQITRAIARHGADLVLQRLREDFGRAYLLVATEVILTRAGVSGSDRDTLEIGIYQDLVKNAAVAASLLLLRPRDWLDVDLDPYLAVARADLRSAIEAGEQQPVRLEEFLGSGAIPG